MTSFARIPTILGLLLGAQACGEQAAKEREPGEAANSSARPVAESHDSGDDEAEDPGERSIVERVERPDPGLILPPDFQGTWAQSLAECASGGWVLVEAGGFRVPDSIAALREPVRIVRQTMPNGQPAATITPRLEFNSEGQQLFGSVRMSRAGAHLYMSNPDVVSEDEHWQHRNVRCPNRGYRANPAD